jgi:hypothetical protein
MKAKPKRTAAPLAMGRANPQKNAASSSKKLTGKNFERAVEQFQTEPLEKKAHEQWKQIEKSIFGVPFED